MSTILDSDNTRELESLNTNNKDLNNIKNDVNNNKNTIEYNSLSNRDAMKDEIHSIHNYLRNSGFGYGMNALKLFNLFYGLHKIETTYNDKHKHSGKSYKEITGLDDKFKFSNIVIEVNKPENSYSIAFIKELIKNVYLAEIKDDNNNTIYPCKDMLFVNIPDDIKPDIIKNLIMRINALCKKETYLNFQLSGKIYEYFIGRDQSAISELGAYFTDRHITRFIYNNVLKPTLKDESTKTIKSMIDPFAGSGGFTLGYIDYLNTNYNTSSSDTFIDWKTQLHNIHHYDANPDVIKYVKLEFYCTTGDFNSSSNVAVHNAFTYHYNNLKFDYIVTNPPYGGDKIDETETIKLFKELKTKIESYFKSKYKLKAVSKSVLLKLCLSDSNDINKINQYTDTLKKLDDYSNEYKTKTVTLDNTGNPRFLNYASEHGIDKSKCKDKESVSFLMMMEMLNDGGTAVGVLKEGLFFDSKYQHLRKHLIEKFNVSRIISIDASQFENTTTKTSIIMFHNNGKTDNIRFSELIVNKDNKTEFVEDNNGTFIIKSVLNRINSVEDKFICNAKYEDIVKANYTFNHKKYNKVELVPGDGFKLVKLGDVCEINFGKRITKSKNGVSETEKIKYPVLGGGNFSFYTNIKNRNKHTLVISRFAVSKECVRLIEEDFYLNDGGLSIKSKNCNQEYLNYLLLSYQDIIYNITTGSIQKGLDMKLFNNLDLPIPDTDEQLQYWVNYISDPYNKIQDTRTRLTTLETQVQKDIQNILDNNECEEVMLGDLCEYIKSGKPISKHKRNGTQYPYYASNGIVGYMDHYLFDGKFIILAQDGSIGSIYNVNCKFYASNHTWILKIIYNDYMFYYIKYKIDFNKYTGGSVIPKLNLQNLKQIKIQLPKDRSVLDTLNPLFDEIDKLNEELPKYEELYKSRLEELRTNAIQE